MKKVKNVIGMIMAMTLALFMAIGAGQTKVSAEVNTTSNGSALVKEVNNADELREYIDEDGAYSSQDVIPAEESYADINKLVLDKDGTLFVCSLEKDGWAYIDIFTNTALTERAANEIRTRKSDRDNIGEVELKAGTYYYRARRWNGSGALTVSTYFGFKPAKGKINKDTGKQSTPEYTGDEVDCTLLSQPDGLDELIKNNAEPASKGEAEMTTRFSAPVRFTVEEDGWFILHAFGKYNFTTMRLYSNIDMTSCIAEKNTQVKAEDEPMVVYLEAGTYYLKGYQWNGSDSMPFTTYLGFFPASSRLMVNEIKLSKDKTYATVTFDYDKEYLPDFLNNTIRVISGAVSPSMVNDKDVWKSNDRANALEQPSVKITQNGTYTARIASKNDDFYCMAEFTVDGIVEAPKLPQITSAKKNGTVIKGSAGAKTEVTVKVGKKSYTATADSKGKWSVTLSSKLTAKTVIKVVSANANGAKSKETKYVVK